MSVKLNSSGGGSITLQEPSTASNRTLTLPDNTGTVISTASTGVVTQAMMATGVAGNGPAFSAYKTALQAITGAVTTKVTFPSEDFDTANCYDTTNSRFTPNVAGYYQINGAVQNSGASTSILPVIYKNGSLWKYGQYTSTSGNTINTVSVFVYLNGTTDYVELYVNFGTTADVSTNVYFQGALVRAA